MTIDTTLPADNPMRFRKTFSDFFRLTEQIKAKRIWKQLIINKQGKQLKKIKDKKKKKELTKRVKEKEKSGEIVLLKDRLNDILLDYGDMNIDAKGEDILKKLARDERMINYNNLFY